MLNRMPTLNMFWRSTPKEIPTLIHLVIMQHSWKNLFGHLVPMIWQSKAHTYSSSVWGRTTGYLGRALG